MELDKYVKQNDKVLFAYTCDSAENCEGLLKNIRQKISDYGKLIVDSTDNIIKGSHQSLEYNVIISGYQLPFFHKTELLREYYRILKPQGVLMFEELFQETNENDSELKFHAHYASRLKLNGFAILEPEAANSGAQRTTKVVARKPDYEPNSQVKLNLLHKKKVETKTTWKINENDDDDLIDESTLIDPNEDIEKPSFAAECKPQNGSRKRRACKDCTCGLAEELANDGKQDIKETPKSSCGNCYLGDAFRCASCPYLGMPAFKPGEKVVIQTMD